LTTKLILTISVAILVTAIASGQNQNDEAALMKKHLQYLTPRLDGRIAKMTILFGDLNGDGVNDAFIDWCIEATENDQDVGGGNALMFLKCVEEGFSVYMKTGNDYLLKADKRKDNFNDEGFLYCADKIENRKIICSSTSYAEDDPRCCPSLKRIFYLVFENDEILKPGQKVKVIKQ
jgi:hypothetical protein